MLFRGRRLIKSSFVSILQQLFTNHVKFPWNKNVLTTKIFIDEEYQKSDRKFPSVIVSDVSNNNFFKTSYDRNYQNEDYEIDTQGHRILKGVRYGGSINPTFQLGISALNIYDLEIIVDVIESFFEFAGVQKLRDAGITITNISDSNITTEQNGKNDIYNITLTFTLYCEWEKYVSVDELETINNVKVQTIGEYIVEGGPIINTDTR